MVEGGETHMRAMDCTLDDHHLEAENDEELFKQAREHVDEAHPEMEFSDEQLRAMIAEQAYDK
jgi:predicted small metal-binding protein